MDLDTASDVSGGFVDDVSGEPSGSRETDGVDSIVFDPARNEKGFEGGGTSRRESHGASRNVLAHFRIARCRAVAACRTVRVDLRGGVFEN